MRFVIVEDEIRIREGIIKLLNKMNQEYEVVGEAENGEEGLGMIRDAKPDIIITDIKMPVLDGLEMLKKLHEDGYKCKAIVLSAYSEFEYARQAMQLGVTEYLLKPIALNEFAQALEHIQKQLDREHIQKPEQIGTLEQILEGIINGSIILNEEISTFLKNKYQIPKDLQVVLTCFYLGAEYAPMIETIKRKIEAMLKQKPEISYCIIGEAHDRSLLMILYGYEDVTLLERWMQYQLLNEKSKKIHVGIGWTQVSSLQELKDQYESLYQYMDWNIALGDEVIISYPKITKIQTAPCIYPVKIENQIKVDICGNDYAGIVKRMEEFHEYFELGKVYAPKEMKECYVRFLWAVINIATEVGYINEQKLEQQKILELIMGAKTRSELRQVAEMILKLRIEDQEEEKEITHLTVKRAVNLIQEFYSSGITLDEIAEKLNITPEYLGTKFHQELGINFSTYIKNYRMIKAKELLIGTQLKLYEIAEKVGYTDSKYFSKVFKDNFGQLPAEYRKTHK
ncbi:MAG: response regulator [Lachnospiraceae bacterium]|nr:response regulator [Lachnospiraceae bacterium]